MKKLLKKIFNFVKRLYNKLIDESKIYIPISIKIVEILKEVMDSPVDDILLAVISKLVPNVPVAQLNIIKAKVEEQLPKLLVELNLINAAVNAPTVNEQLQMILNALKVSPDNVKAEKYHTLASKLLVILSDGKITWSEAVVFTEWYYQTYLKTND